MNALAKQLNRTLGPVADLLSPAGKRLYFPYGGILGQGAEARTCGINATIGMAFEEDGSPLVMKCFADRVNLDRRAFLYAGSFGLPALRETWKKLQVKKNPSLKGIAYSNPVVTNALTHGLRIAAELFAGRGDKVVIPDLYWDNYSLIFEEACGAAIETFNTFRDEKGVHGESLFAAFATLDPNVLAVKLDGCTKEDYVWGLRVGFISFAFKGATPEQLKALEAKAAGNVRSCVSNITSIGQNVALAALSDKDYAKQKREKYNVLKKRYTTIRTLLRKHPAWAETFEVMPFNSGYFMCVKPVGVDAERVRRQLIEKYSTGTIVLSGLIRLAFSTVPVAKLPTLFANVDAAIRDLRS